MGNRMAVQDNAGQRQQDHFRPRLVTRQGLTEGAQEAALAAFQRLLRDGLAARICRRKSYRTGLVLIPAEPDPPNRLSQAVDFRTGKRTD
jgi:hypothetical protein